MITKLAAVLFWVCVGGFSVSIPLAAFFFRVPGANAGQFVLNAALFAVGAAANYLFLKSRK
jgi:hypothetical protein